MQSEEYPFVQELVTDPSEQGQKIVLRDEDYQQLLESIEDEELYGAIQDVKHEKPLSLAEALQELEQP